MAQRAPARKVLCPPLADESSDSPSPNPRTTLEREATDAAKKLRESVVAATGFRVVAMLAVLASGETGRNWHPAVSFAACPHHVSQKRGVETDVRVGDT